MILSLRRCILLSLFAVASANAQDRIESTDALFPGALDPLDRSWVLSRVVDDLTGAPIANAAVYFVRESDTPLAGEFWFTRKVQTDKDGWLRAPVADIERKWHIQVLRHRDYGVAARVGQGGDIWRVGRPFDVPVLVRDWQGRPATGATIGFCGGCGHTPDLVNAVTDANGIAILKQIDPHSDIGDVYVQRTGLGLGYDSVRWMPGAPPVVIDCDWSPAMHGTVVDHKGHPVAGAHVAALDVHRGPWAKTAVDGTFRLLGGKPEVGASHVRTADGREIWFEGPERYPVTLRLPDPHGSSPHEGTIVEPPRNQKAATVRTIEVNLVGHDQLIATCDWPSSAGPCKGTKVLQIPSSGPFVIELWVDDGAAQMQDARAFAYDDASELPGEPIELRWFEPTHLVGRIVGEAGEPVPARVFLRQRFSVAMAEHYQDRAAVARFSIATWRIGLHLVEIVPVQADLQPRLVWAMLPALGQKARVNLGSIKLSKTAQLRVLDGDGHPVPGAVVGFARAGYQKVGYPHRFPLAPDGAFCGPDLVSGDVVVVRLSNNSAPWRTVLQGEGPWIIRAPRGQLQLDIEGVADLEVTCVIGDHVCRWRKGQPISGLRHGPLRCYVSAPGRRSVIVDTMIGKQIRHVVMRMTKR